MLQEGFVGVIGHCQHRKPHGVNVFRPGQAYKDLEMPRAMSVPDTSSVSLFVTQHQQLLRA